MSRDTALKRLRKELKDLRKGGELRCFSVGPAGDDMMVWEASIFNFAPESLYHGGVFKLSIVFSNRYPFVAPKVVFLTKIWHSNISSKSGQICLDILKNSWSPVYTVEKLLLSIIALLENPNPEDPLEPTVAKMYRENRPKHDIMARAWTERYA